MLYRKTNVADISDIAQLCLLHITLYCVLIFVYQTILSVYFDYN